MITPKQFLVTMYSFKGINAKKKVKEVYNEYLPVLGVQKP